jgi:carbamate kinase
MQGEAYPGVEPYPLDLLGAETEGMIGYLIERELRSLLPTRHIITLLTQVEVNRADAAFRHPAKMIGPPLDQQKAEHLADEHGWKIVPDGAHWRRVVPSPEPLRFLELPVIRLLIKAGVLVVCAGGGGIPVTVSKEGAIKGAEAVVDKDLSAALLAHQVGADALLLLTDVAAVYRNWHEKGAEPIRETTTEELRSLNFTASSMKPKVEAACRFIESGGSFSGIGLLDDAVSILGGQRGTLVRPPEKALDFTDSSGLKLS